MLVFSRQCLVLLLVLLQYAAPLVHAHTGGDNFGRGLHLYEFENLHLVADSLAMKACDHSMASESAIVNIGSAINLQQTPEKSIKQYCLFVFSSFLQPEPNYQEHSRNLSSASDPISIVQLHLCNNTPRAPPAPKTL